MELQEVIMELQERDLDLRKENDLDHARAIQQRRVADRAAKGVCGPGVARAGGVWLRRVRMTTRLALASSVSWVVG